MTFPPTPEIDSPRPELSPDTIARLGPDMTLRDWFAGEAVGECFKQAMKRGFEWPQHIDQYTERAAYWAYRIADAMLAERSK